MSRCGRTARPESRAYAPMSRVRSLRAAHCGGRLAISELPPRARENPPGAARRRCVERFHPTSSSTAHHPHEPPRFYSLSCRSRRGFAPIAGVDSDKKARKALTRFGFSKCSHHSAGYSRPLYPADLSAHMSPSASIARKIQDRRWHPPFMGVRRDVCDESSCHHPAYGEVR